MTLSRATRADWLSRWRRHTVDHYDREARTYDDNEIPADTAHVRFVTQLIESCPSGGAVLDAACGTGRYVGAVLAARLAVTAADQSMRMLARAADKYPGLRTVPVGLQELCFGAEFDAALCVDAIEFVPPEDWLVILGNLRRALRPGGLLYLTVEKTDAHALSQANQAAVSRGLPVVPGEWVGRAGQYHFYPTLTQVETWIRSAGFEVVSREHGDGAHPSYSYEHYLMVKAGLNQV